MKKLLAAAVLALTLFHGEAKAQPANVQVSMCSDPFGTHSGTLVLAQARITHSSASTLYFWYGVQDSTDGNVYLAGSAVTPACGDTYEISFSFFHPGTSSWDIWDVLHLKEYGQGNPMGPGMVVGDESLLMRPPLQCVGGSYPLSGTGSTDGYLSGGTLYLPPGAPSSTPPDVDCGVGLPSLPTGVINPSC